jgi:hypothetical protein
MYPLYLLVKAILISRGTTTWEEHLAKKNENKEICAGIKAGNPELWGSYKNEKSAEGGVSAAIQKILGRTEQRATAAAAAEERNDTQPRIIPYDKCDVEENPRVAEQPNIEEKEKTIDVTRCRDMTKCFTDGQRIRHKGHKTQTTWIGTYDSTKGKIIYDGNSYTLNMFAVTHYKTERPDRTSKANAWAECECEKDGEWVSTFSLHA